ncbi:MAG: single-stranded DNA-binding protein [Anaerolineae bacterium]|nr:single-stranded DNA-binding protein [Anaerolineae bacterium]
MYQRLVLVGYLGRDPEMRYTPQGTPVTSFPVATNRRYTTADGQQKEETVWFRVSVWGKQAEIANQYLTKGRRVLVEGSLIGDENGGPRIWTDRDGKPRASFEVRAYTVRFMESKREATASTGTTNGSAALPDVDELTSNNDEVPF